MFSKVIKGSHESVGLVSGGKKKKKIPSEKKKGHFRRETLKEPPGLIFKSVPSEGKEGK